MCYDISFTIEIKEIADYFPGLIYDEQLEFNFDPVHIFAQSHLPHPIIFRNKEDQKLHLKWMEWSIIPSYISDEAGFNDRRKKMANIRSERILDDKTSYWNVIHAQRCLIPVTGFYESQLPPGYKTKIPYYIHMRNRPIFFIPGLYTVTRLIDKNTGEIDDRWTFGLITRAANELMREIHNSGENPFRMPLMFTAEETPEWLDGSFSEKEYRKLLDYELPSQELEAWTIFNLRTQKLRKDNKGKTDFYDWQIAPQGSLF